MKRFFIPALLLILPGQLNGETPAVTASAVNPIVVIDTTQGTIKAVLYQGEAPVSVDNFLKYINDRAYDGTIFHRVIRNFVIQGGGYDSDFQKRKTRAPIKNEGSNGLRNERGTLSMARTHKVDSATNQFFINLKHNKHLDYTRGRPGHAVFGKVVKGMEVVDRIAAISTGSRGPFNREYPKTDVIIKTIRLK